jgi:hypothetical protein
MRIKCNSVRLQSLVSISDKAYKATGFDGSEAILPKSQVFGVDHEVHKSDAYWISAWILEQKDLQFSTKKEAWFDKDTGQMLPSIKVEHHKPAKKESLITNEIKELQK